MIEPDVVLWIAGLIQYYLRIGLPWIVGLALGLAAIRLAIHLLGRWPLASSASDLSNRTILFYTFLLMLPLMAINLYFIDFSYEWTISPIIFVAMLGGLVRPWPFSKSRFMALPLAIGLLGMPCLIVHLLSDVQRVGLASTLSLCFLLLFFALLSTSLSLAFAIPDDHDVAPFRRVTPRQVQTAGVLILFGVVLLNGVNPYKLQFDHLPGYPKHPLGWSDGHREGVIGPRKLKDYQNEEM